jgi:hypothetical protein
MKKRMNPKKSHADRHYISSSHPQRLRFNTTFCGQNLLDTQDPSSYTRQRKNEVLINLTKIGK